MRLIFLLVLFFSCSHKILDKSFYKNNQIRYEVEKQNGKEHGIAKFWDESGNLINKVQYSYGQIHGEWIRFYKTGEMESIMNYEFDKKNGYEINYYKDGTKKSEVLYENDIRVSDITRWDIDGKLIN